MVALRHRLPCNPSYFVDFRKRTREEDIDKVFARSVLLHGKDACTDMFMSDTTVQDDNISFPTDTRRAKKVKKSTMGA